MSAHSDEYWMQRALALAERAAIQNEVPVGAVLVYSDSILSEGYNNSISENDPTGHAEMIALRRAGEKIGNYRLIDTTLYVTLEPCLMCAGAMMHARIKRLVYGANEPKTGAVISTTQVFDQVCFNHRIQYQNGILAKECGNIIQQFFRDRR